MAASKIATTIDDKMLKQIDMQFISQHIDYINN
jgi:hypothetical protein